VKKIEVYTESSLDQLSSGRDLLPKTNTKQKQHFTRDPVTGELVKDVNINCPSNFDVSRQGTRKSSSAKDKTSHSSNRMSNYKGNEQDQE
jgi:hypothetical protein